jgi:hypothetical protein
MKYAQITVNHNMTKKRKTSNAFAKINMQMSQEKNIKNILMATLFSVHMKEKAEVRLFSLLLFFP